MNYFLMLIIILLCGGSYYEYNQLQQKGVADHQQISDLTDKVNSLQTNNKKLTDDQAQLKKSADDSLAEINDLTKQVQDAQTALETAKAQIVQLKARQTTAASSPAPASAPVWTNLETVATLDGKSYQNCQLLKVEADGIVINHADGITKLAYGLLPPELQKKFDYDPHGPPSLSDDQVQALEAQRKASGQTAKN